jgi:sporulation protein YlmC with PRC-barrel domain
MGCRRKTEVKKTKKRDNSVMNTNKLKTAVLTTVLCVGTSALVCAQNYSPSTSSGRHTGDTDKNSTSSSSTSSTSSSDQAQLQKINRASELIGSTVKNEQGERLGKIRDLVVDFSGDKVAYAVLAADSGMLSSEKLHAVPLRAFHPSEDGKYMILNTDKDKLSRAEGFDKNNWPSPQNPSWGAQPFWQDPNGATPATSSDMGTSSTTTGSKYNEPSSTTSGSSKADRDQSSQSNDTMNKHQPRQSPPYGTQENQSQSRP